MSTQQDLKTTVPAIPPTDGSRGLSGTEVHQRLVQYGPNAIAEKSISPWRQFIVKFWAPVPWMLEAVIVLQIVLGRHLEALVIAVLLAFNAMVAFLQELRAKDALALLRKTLHVSARVLRDDRWQQIPAEQLVPVIWCLLICCFQAARWLWISRRSPANHCRWTQGQASPPMPE